MAISLKIVHHSLRLILRFHHRMHVIASYMRCQQTPTTMRAHVLNRFQNGVPTDLVQVIGRLIHALFFPDGTHGIGVPESGFQEHYEPDRRSRTHRRAGGSRSRQT